MGLPEVVFCARKDAEDDRYLLTKFNGTISIYRMNEVTAGQLLQWREDERVKTEIVTEAEIAERLEGRLAVEETPGNLDLATDSSRNFSVGEMTMKLNLETEDFEKNLDRVIEKTERVGELTREVADSFKVLFKGEKDE